MCNCACFRSRSGMNYHSCRLLDHNQILILEVDLERNLLRCEWCRGGAVQIQSDGFPTSNPITGLVPAAINEDTAGPIEQLNLRASEIFHSLDQKDVQTKPAVSGFGQEFHCE